MCLGSWDTGCCRDILAVFINVVKCTYFSSLEICDVSYLENGIIQNNWKNSYKEGEKTKYFCNINYHAENENGEIMCTKNGWSPIPRCIRKSKRAYFLSQFLSKTNKSMITLPMATFGIGATVTYRCYNDFVTPERQEMGTIQCQKNGFRVPYCGPPPEITNGNVTGGFLERYQHGNRMEYECDTQFKLVGSKEIECLDGQWSSPPSCIGNLPTTISFVLILLCSPAIRTLQKALDIPAKKSHACCVN
uniref:Sushi domain-containing protein n=1 Tax=Pavo cristatus TaxID=9049 RepID=A0A8C9FXF5_PAVCR